MRYVRGFGRFWFDFLIGDDWRIAAGVAGVLAAGAVLLRASVVDETLLVVLVAAALLGVAVASIVAGGIAAARAAHGFGSEIVTPDVAESVSERIDQAPTGEDPPGEPG